MTLNAVGTQPILARFREALHLKAEYRVANSEALETFRGTLIDGVLQPNVRLGNGLHLSRETHMTSNLEGQKPDTRQYKTKEFDRSVGPPTQVPTKPKGLKGAQGRQDSSPPSDLELREARIAEREQEIVLLQEQIIETLRIQNTRPGQERSARAGIEEESRRRAAELEARERALEQKEELLRYKRKVWILEQKLAQATGRPPPIYDVQEHGPDVLEHNPQSSLGGSSSEEARTELQAEDPDEDYVSSIFDLGNTAPPKALEDLRSRTQLPIGRTLSQKRAPRSR
jgi:hypothetical protein